MYRTFSDKLVKRGKEATTEWNNQKVNIVLYSSFVDLMDEIRNQVIKNYNQFLGGNNQAV